VAEAAVEAAAAEVPKTKAKEEKREEEEEMVYREVAWICLEVEKRTEEQ
jgi:hypothetical protein